jgi:regulator of sigma E protease
LFYLLSSPFRPEGGAKLEDVHGIVVATNFMAEFIRQDVMEGLRWGGIFSLELALFNLLPILPLDGGHVAFQIGEMVTGGRQLPRLKQGVASLGLAMILTLMVIVIFNDLRYLFAPDQL